MILRRKLQNGETNQQLDALLANLPENNDHIANYILQHNGQLPPQPMFEKHPYSYNEFKLGYDKMIIGTFPPISYIYDHPLLVENNISQNKRPEIPFFHGNKPTGSMWESLLIGNCFDEILNLNRDFRKKELIDELIYRFIRYEDIIKYTRRKLKNNVYSAEDTKLFNIIPNTDIINDIIKKRELKAILFNTSTTFSKNIKVNINNYINVEADNNIKAFDLFIRTLQEMNYKVEFKLENIDDTIIQDWIEVNYQNRNLIKNIFSYKIIFKVRVSKSSGIIKEFYAITPFSPAARGRVKQNPIVSNWLENNVNKNHYDLLKDIYHSFSLFSNNNEFIENKEFLFNLNYYA